ncbi:hypothetical protein AAFF_G00374310 [Aldrovandia affinis]|uniref:Uncharacterized protein n=1 Tax=Aldrovandia affinis TaxID=143900 RepID=A0AAD7WM79_9TELE|nr:hypothetical protein AAFF_G00374310 [Aldrovandia affinis]
MCGTRLSRRRKAIAHFLNLGYVGAVRLGAAARRAASSEGRGRGGRERENVLAASSERTARGSHGSWKVSERPAPSTKEERRRRTSRALKVRECGGGASFDR